MRLCSRVAKVEQLQAADEKIHAQIEMELARFRAWPVYRWTMWCPIAEIRPRAPSPISEVPFSGKLSQGVS
jgi:hypothetical protein